MIPTRDIVDQLVAAGAIMTRPGTPLRRDLVGALHWAGDDAVFWFSAFGDAPADGRLVRFDAIEIHPVGACFMQGAEIVAFLAPIEKAAVPDVDDYRIAWRLWQEVAPLREPLIARVFDALLASDPVALDAVDHPGGKTAATTPAFL